MTPRSSFATEFLLRELLSSLGAPLRTATEPTDSFSEELSEDTESQFAVKTLPSRVMLVRRTNSLHQTVTLVDRDFDIEAYIPRHVINCLKKNCGYNTIGCLRGSVVRLTKYHFATLKRCRLTDQQNFETSVSVPYGSTETARVYLWVDALTVVEDNELAVQLRPEVYSHPLVLERLKKLSDVELEKQLMINQGLLPLPIDLSDRFDENRPLLEEDCVIPEDQKQQLEEQEEWGPPIVGGRHPTDSELIEENGVVPLSQSQLFNSGADDLLSTHDSMASSGELSVMLSENLWSGIHRNQGFQFQQEDIQKTFVADSDFSGSDAEEKAVDLADNIIERGVHSEAIMIEDVQINDTTQKQRQGYTTASDGAQEKGDKVFTLLSHASPNSHRQAAKKQTSTTSSELVNTLTVDILTNDSESSTTMNEVIVRDEHRTRNLAQIKNKKENADIEDMLAPEEFMSSQATMVIHYAIDDDEEANAFDYEVITPTDSSKDRYFDDKKCTLSQKSEESDDMISTEKKAEVIPSSQKESEATKDDVNILSACAHAVLDTDEETESEATLVPTPVAISIPANRDTDAHAKHNLEIRVPPANTSKNSRPISTPSKIVISVSSNVHRASQTGFSSATRNEETKSRDVQSATGAVESNARSDCQSHAQPHKRRRQNIFQTRKHCEVGSQCRRFRNPIVSSIFQRGRDLERIPDTTIVYSLDTLCRSLDSSGRSDTTEERHTRSRRVWKRYEKLFPSLNST
ncbi:uncharacterized protein PHALS_07694 [Plasmopara halstedii]|uniref:Uncharacterized protein n=1 Tax=Plasmopara halstedii TaxID=4781 RepID=A0A0P1B6N6_PLAHL|nr:uncharacterized protein PHALS_07694 [Plasmopara halstedii]CEG49959.1 hypothetical protein PHALS_07694 [Plasmopara halstedii]|eukprot:XP_024586328.1 hypothetical protein PHALS_07694 [Plasmopara halstedii]